MDGQRSSPHLADTKSFVLQQLAASALAAGEFGNNEADGERLNRLVVRDSNSRGVAPLAKVRGGMLGEPGDERPLLGSVNVETHFFPAKRRLLAIPPYAVHEVLHGELWDDDGQVLYMTNYT